MNNALLIYEGLRTFADAKALIGKQEYVFLDFKESRSTNGALLDDDKDHFSKAASGFAHQEGGVIVWGIEARKGPDDVDEARALKPISNIKKFLSGLNDYVKYSTEPVVDGIQSRVIFENDDESSNVGYAVTLFPKSNSEHIALGNTKHDFYRRHGDSFVPLSTADIRALFFRSSSPDLELRALSQPGGSLRLMLHNKGRGVAKYASAHIGWAPNQGGLWYDGEGNDSFKVGFYVNTHQEPYVIQFIANTNVVVHPEEEIGILTGPSTHSGRLPKVSKIFYRLYAENMVPKEGTLEL
ncbi:MAG: hypothetical protein ABSE79_19660 [Terriglobia bacterium]|jgi:hypothetical protein